MSIEGFGVEIVGDPDKVRDFLDDYGEKIARGAMNAATNKTLEQGRTQIRQAVVREAGIPSSALSGGKKKKGKGKGTGRFRLYRANKNRPFARLFIGTKGVSAHLLGARELKGWKGVSHKGPGGRVRAPHAFIRTVGGEDRVFERKGSARLPLRIVRVEFHEIAKRAANRFIQESKKIYDKILARELGFRTKKELDKL